jgi:hypothetical protein
MSPTLFLAHGQFQTVWGLGTHSPTLTCQGWNILHALRMASSPRRSARGKVCDLRQSKQTMNLMRTRPESPKAREKEAIMDPCRHGQ